MAPVFSEDDFLPISALQHFAFCPRQWALIHLEGMWEENVLTVEGKHLHERADASPSEGHGSLRIARGLRVHSRNFGLYGRADVVEFERIPSSEKSPGAAVLPSFSGLWRVRPVEYKRGKPKPDRCDEIQLCAQALCLEEMLDAHVDEGAIFYGKPRRRKAVAIDERLRMETSRTLEQMRAMWERAETPKAVHGPKCKSCSLLDMCQPQVTNGTKSAKKHLERNLRALLRTSENSTS